jgi:two-component system, cell cycle sensor histidine kinase and response regulator CckA
VSDTEMAQRLQTVTLSSIADAVIATDIAGTITFLNPEAERLTRWPQSDAIGRPLTDVFRVIGEDTRLAAEDPASVVLRTGSSRRWPITRC